MTDVLGCSAAEAAECLGSSVASVNSALQRARATLGDGAIASDARPETELSDAHSELLDRYLDAFQRYDVDALVALVRDDATFSMPPYRLWLQGPASIRAWLLGRGCGCRGSRLIPTRASGAPAFGQSRPDPDGGHKPWALIVLELADGQIAGWNSFLDTDNLFTLFDLPLHIG